MVYCTILLASVKTELEILEDPLAIKEEHHCSLASTPLSVGTDDDFQLKDTTDKNQVQFPSLDYCEPEEIERCFQENSASQCIVCKKRYSSTSNLKSHMRNMHSVEPEVLPCNICGKIFKSKKYLNMHKYRMHGIRQRFVLKRY